MKSFRMFIVLHLILLSCSFNNGPVELEIIASFKAKPISLDNISSVQWDSIYLYGPYHDLEDILSKHSLKRADLYNVLNSDYINDSNSLVVIQHEGNIQKVLLVNRGKIDLVKFLKDSPYRR